MAAAVPDASSAAQPGPRKEDEDAALEDKPAPKRAVVSWIVYDLANTLFSFVILSFYYGPWIVDDLGARDSWVAVPQAVAMLFVLLGAPVLGAVSDRGRKVPFLVVSTIVAAGMTTLLGLGRWLDLPTMSVVLTAAVVYVVANIGYQLGLVFYDALLPVIATPKTMGRIGSYGVGIGYIGSFVGLALGATILGRDPDGEPLLFVATGIAFLLLAIPAFLFVREPRDPKPVTWRDVRSTAKDVLRTVRSLPKQPVLGRFLLARVLYADAVNTTLLILGIYAVTEAGFRSDTTAYSILLGLGIGVAVIAAPLWGLLVDHAGPRNTLSVVLLVWLLNLTVVAVHPVLALPQALFYVYGALVGVGLAGVWTADRPLLVGLVPRKEVGRWFGMYTMAGRFASVMGPLLWAFTVDVAFAGNPNARPYGILVLVVMLAASWWLLRGIQDPTHGTNPLARFVPWRDRKPRQRFPWFTLLLVGVSWTIFIRLRTSQPGIDTVDWALLEPYAYHIPDLSDKTIPTLLKLFPAVWLSHDSVQLIYTSILLLLFMVPFERHEGTLRTVPVFAGTTALAAIFAGILLHALQGNIGGEILGPILDQAWQRHWTGASVGAFGIMGALAARARKPWLLLAVFVLWELNVGGWYLRSYTPAFHLSALAIGYLWVRLGVRPFAKAPAASEA